MLDNVLLRMVSTASAVGIYSFSIKIVRISTNLLADSFLVFLPRIVSLAGNNDDVQLRQKLQMNMQLVILAAIPMGIGLFLIADELAVVFFGQKFLMSANDLRVLSIFPFLKGMSLYYSNPVLIAHHKERFFLRNLIVSSCLFIPAALVLGSMYSDWGICIALIGAEFLLMASNYFTVKKRLPHLPIFDLATALQALTGALLFIPVVYATQYFIYSDQWRLIISIIACIVCYGFFLVIVARNKFAITLMNICIKFFRNIFYSAKAI